MPTEAPSIPSSKPAEPVAQVTPSFENIQGGGDPIPAGDADALRPAKFKVGDDTFEKKLSELRDKIAREKAGIPDPDPKPLEQKPETVKAEVKADQQKEVERKAADLHTDITAETPDAELEARIKENSKGLSKEQLKAFKELTYENRQYKKDLKVKAELEIKVKELEARGEPAIKELEATKKRLEEQEMELAATRIEKTQKFRETIAEPMAALEKSFATYTTEFELPEGAIMEAAALKGRARGAALGELASEMAEPDRIKFYNLVDRYTELHAQAEELRRNAKTNYDRIMQEQREGADKESAAHRAAYQAALDKAWKTDIEANVAVIKERAGDPDFNERLKAVHDFAKTADVTRYGPDEQAVMAYRTAAFPILNGELQAAHEQNAKLLQQIQALKGAKPSSGNGRVASAPSQIPAADDSKKTLEQRFKEEFGNLTGEHFAGHGR